MKRIAYVLIAAALAVGLTACGARSGPEDASVAYPDPGSTELGQEIRLAASDEETDPEAIAALGEKAAAMTDGELAELIEANLDSSIVARALIAAAKGNGADLSDDLLSKLFESGLDTDVKLLALDYCSESAKDRTDVIAKLTDDPELASFALRALYEKDPDRAVGIADGIIAEYDGSCGSRLMGALHVKQYYLHENGSDEEIADYIALCDEIAKGCKKYDDSARAVLADLIGSIDSRKGLEYVIDNPDYIEKSKVAWYNSSTVASILSGEPDAESIDLVFRALEADRVVDFGVLLRENLEKNPGFYEKHPELTERADKILNRGS